MSRTCEHIHLKDDRLGCPTAKIKCQVFKADSTLLAQHARRRLRHHRITCTTRKSQVWRRLFVDKCSGNRTITLMIKSWNKSTSKFTINYGIADTLAPFPLNSSVNVMTVTIKNNTVSLNVQETLPIIPGRVDA